MPRGKATLNGHAANGHVRNPAVSTDGGSELLADVPSVQAGEDRSAAASIAFAWLCCRTDGWIRVAGGNTEKVNYFKYKFSSGPHSNKYVMYVAPIGAWVEGISGLAKKVMDVDDGTLRPAHDTFYDPR